MEILSYPYRPKPLRVVLAAALFGAGALFMGREAMLNERGLIINGVIHLGRSGATIFYWCIAGIAAAFAAMGILALLVGLFSSRRVTLTETEISAPKTGFSRAPTVVRFADITRVSTGVAHRQRFLDIFHINGKLTVGESFLPNRAAFEELCAAVISRIPGSDMG